MISSTGFWDDNHSNKHNFDQLLCQGLIRFLKKENVTSAYDFGCGPGWYVKDILLNGIDIKGYDGNPNTPSLTDGVCNVLDLSIEHALPQRDWAISLEVGEHIPKRFEEKFINNLHYHNTKGVILSWAVPGQGGHGHVNECSNEYIKGLFDKLGYTNDLEAEKELREASNDWWFKDTIMVFRKNDRL